MSDIQPAGDLAKLLAALRNAADPWSRLKLVATGARTLAKLTPEQRVQLLRQLGLQGAEELAEAAAGGDPRTTAAMAKALRDLEADPRRLQQLAGAIADPSSRRATLVGLGAHVIEAMGAPAAPTAAPGRAAGAHQPSRVAAQPPAPEPPQIPTPPVPARPTPPLPPTPTPPSATPPSAGTPTPPAPSTPVPPASSTPHHAPTAAPLAPAMGGGVVATPVGVPPRPELPSPVRPEAPAAAAPPAPPTSSAAGRELPDATLAVPVAAAQRSAAHVDAAAGRGALATLRELRRQLDAGGTVDGEAVAALFARDLTHDWARRRALGAFFARRPPAEVDDALSLIGELETAAGRRWALADLAGSRAWRDDEWERLLAAADGPGLRRRLAMRRRRA